MGLAQEHIAVAVAVELARRLARRRDVVTLLGVHLRRGDHVRLVERVLGLGVGVAERAKVG